MTPSPIVRSATRRFLHTFLARAADLVPERRYDREEDLEKDLADLSRSLGVEAVDGDSLPEKLGGVPQYYTETEAQYAALHSPAGSVHFALSRDGIFDHDHFYEQPRFVESIIVRAGARDVLELGSGKGFNSIYVAQRHPEVRITGVDLTPAHVRLATERARGLGNVRFVEGDFHRLDAIPDASIDLAVDVEAGCYSDTPEKIVGLFTELRRVIKPGGRFVAWGYYRAPDHAQRSRAQQRAVELVERSWVLQRFPPIDEWDRAAHEAGFSFESTEHQHLAVMPGLRRLTRGARLYYFVRPMFRRLLGQPTHNSVSVLMLPYGLMLGAIEYRQAVLVRGGD